MMEHRETKQKNEIIELLGLQNETEKIQKQNQYFVIKGADNLDSRKQELSIVLEKYPQL